MFTVVDDVNFVVSGLASFAATVGYVCTRKLAGTEVRTIARDAAGSSSMNNTAETTVNEETKDSSAATTTLSEVVEERKSQEVSTQSSSLKRKRTQDEEDEDALVGIGYPHNLQLIYPAKKRNRTPSSESDSQEVVKEIIPVAETVKAITTTPENSSKENAQDVPPSQVVTPLHGPPEISPPELDERVMPSNVALGSSSITLSPLHSSLQPAATPPHGTPRTSPRVLDERPETPSNVVFGSSATMLSPLPSFLQPSQRPMSRTSSAFSAFTGSSSAFLAASPSKTGVLKPAWSAPDVLRNLNDEPEVAEGDEQDGASHVLVAAAASNATTVEHITGEENEDVKLELKGVKMFMKRGARPFSDGMVGHIKVLSDKTTLNERLLFRREPLWQVSLNVRLHPSVRCVFDASENALRIILTEREEKKEECEVVIYAFKPGRSCSKQDFKEFAEAFVKSPGLTVKVDP